MSFKQSELTMAVLTDYPKAFDTIDFFPLINLEYRKVQY